MTDTILVVDDQPAARKALASELMEAGYDVIEASDGVEAWDLFSERGPDLIITDMVMPRADGFDLLTRVRNCSDIPLIMFTAFDSIKSAVSAVKGGANEFLSSNDMEITDFIILVRKLLDQRDNALQSNLLIQAFPGSSRPSQRTRERLRALATLRTPVLFIGEPGSGRSTAARALHHQASDSPFIQMDAKQFSYRGSLPSSESTIYLKDVEHLNHLAQAFWARRLTKGSRGDSPRFVGSTSVVLDQDRNFRPDLARELLRFKIDLSPLRSRQEDIPALAASMIARIGAELGRSALTLTPAAIKLLSEQRWPGNLAELHRVIERAIAFSVGSSIPQNIVSDILSELEESVEAIRRTHLLQERNHLLSAMRATGGNISHTAEMLGKSRSAIYRLISKHQIRVSRYRSGRTCTN